MILIDGKPCSEVDAWDRGLHFGDGIFETLAVFRDQGIRHWPEHYARLAHGCRKLGLSCPEEILLQSEIQSLLPDRERKIVKLIVTRGSSPRGYRCPKPAAERRILLSCDWPEYPSSWECEGVVLRLCRTRLSRNPDLAGIKHCNRLEQVLARREWEDEAAEGLMLDTENHVIEGTMSNLFLVEGEALRTRICLPAGSRGSRARKFCSGPRLKGYRFTSRRLRLQMCAELTECSCATALSESGRYGSSTT